MESHKQREDLYEKIINSQQSDRSVYDERLHARIESLRRDTAADIEHLHRSTQVASAFMME